LRSRCQPRASPIIRLNKYGTAMTRAKM
jgi:hypothetical protein